MAWFLTKLFCFNAKIMKISKLLSLKAWMAFVITCSGLSLLSSCGKNDDIKPAPVGPANVRYVNTVQGSASQDLYVNDSKKNTQAVAYGDASAYMEITSGPNVFKFYDAGTTTLKAESRGYNIPIGTYVTAFYVQTSGGQLGAFAVGDDMSAPATGKSKVRFFHMNSFLGQNVRISVSVAGQTAVLIPALEYIDSNAPYFSVDAGTRFTFAAPGVTNAPVYDAGLVAGKNYTIWIDGTNSATLTGHAILQN